MISLLRSLKIKLFLLQMLFSLFFLNYHYEMRANHNMYFYSFPSSELTLIIACWWETHYIIF